MMNRVLHVIDTLDIGGAEKITVLLLNLFSEKGHTTGLATILDSGRLSGKINKDVKHISLKRRSKWSIKTARIFMKLASNYDIIHIHLRHNLKWVLFWSILLRKKINIIFHDHSNTVLKFNLLFLLHQCKVSHIIVNQALHIKQSQTSPFKPRSYLLENIINKIPARGKYRNNSDTLSIVIVSNLRRIKNVEFAIKLANYIADEKKVTLDIYYSHYEKEYSEKIYDLIDNEGSQLRINLIKDEIEPQLFFNEYDLAFHPSFHESGPLNILEYMAHGLPFLSYNTGQSIKLIQQKFPEFIVNSFKIEEWICKLEIILNNGRLYYNSSLINIFKQHISLDNYYSECKKIYIESLA